ncbi:unnamed protein product [Nippostrongylus brasiliensis]|uniref:t-SNARE coiled-coil homology domain-containing protein n=1 Tax=Nippostrongylus brasiliensis TaxID=27835 RepID=A0A0N4YVE9_NIPBR|nr:unnamed protein product [Nippostrongylus brasiliensis]
MTDDIGREIELMQFERLIQNDAVGQTLQNIVSRLDSLFNLVAEMKNDVRILMDRPTPKSSCVFFSFTGNVDNHYTGRCHRYPDPRSRAMRLS